jgi:hypothetical protein
MCFVAPLSAFATGPIDRPVIITFAVAVLLALYTLHLARNPARTKAMAAVASELGLQFFPELSADELGTRGASFVRLNPAPGRNCMRGTINGRETLIFDLCNEGLIERTVVGFRVAADNFCRDRGLIQRTFWHVEKMGEWVFVYHEEPPVKPEKIPSYVEEARARFETAINPKGSEPTTLSSHLR